MKEIYILKKNQSKVLNNCAMDKSTRVEEMVILDERIHLLEASRFMRARDTTDANYFLIGKTMCKL